MKLCARCKVEKPDTDFNWRSKTKGTRRPECRACQRADYVRDRAKDPSAYNAATKERKRKWRKAHPDAGKEWYASNRERERNRNLARSGSEQHKATKRAWAARNREKTRAASKRWNNANRETLRAYLQAHYEANKSRYFERSRRRRALKSAATIVPFTQQELDARMSVFGHRCAYCGGPFEHIDHVKPLSKGGPHCLANLRPSCATCNLRKFAKHPRDWFSRAS
jgi:hypothetical protein